MTLDAKAFNEMRAKFNERVRRYAISAGAHAAFTLANYIAFDLLRPSKQSDFITDEELAVELNMSVSTIQRLRKKLVPLGLVVTPGKWRSKATEYAVGPAKGVMDDTLSNTGKHVMDDTLSDRKPVTGDAESRSPVQKKPVTGDRSLTRREIQEKNKERERAGTRHPLSRPADDDSRNLRAKNQPAEQQVPSEADVEFGLSKGLSIDAINREAEKYRELLPDMTFRLWLMRAIEYEERHPKARPEGVGLTGFMGGLEAALSAREAKRR